MNVKPSVGPGRAMRYNGFLAADINGGAAPGYSSGQAQAAIERIAARDAAATASSYEWTDLTYQEILAGNTAILVFPLACCWCSWCWPRSTKAWRCRWRSS